MARAQRRLWPELGPSVALGFVLYGGTAVSLHLGHRRSVDFDFFTDRPLNAAAIRRGFGFAGSAKTLQQAKDSLVVLASGVKLSFFGGMRFGVTAGGGKVDVVGGGSSVSASSRIFFKECLEKDVCPTARDHRAAVCDEVASAAGGASR